MRRLFVLPLIVLARSACRSAPTASFDVQAAEFINSHGAGAIDGHAFYRGENGKVIYAAGEHAFLIPVTPYAEQRFYQVYGKGKYVQTKYMPWDDADPQFRKYTRSTKAESNGRFSFDHVAPGDYFVATSVSWWWLTSRARQKRRTPGASRCLNIIFVLPGIWPRP